MSDIRKQFKQVVGLKDFILAYSLGGNSYNELPLVQAANIVFSNTKTPIWDFANQKFKQVAEGKQLVEGTIVIKTNQIGEISTSIGDAKKIEEIEKRVEGYNEKIHPYIRDKVLAIKEKALKANKDVNSKNILDTCLKMLEARSAVKMKLMPTNALTSDLKFELVDVNFVELQNTMQISEGAGIAVFKFFANWQRIA